MSSVLMLPWLLVLVLIGTTADSELAREIALVGSGFLALLFGAALFLLLLPFSGDRSLLMRKTLLLMLALSPLALLPLPWSGSLLLLGASVLIWLFPGWQKQKDPTVRLEPIFFELVGIKAVILLLLLLV